MYYTNTNNITVLDERNRRVEMVTLLLLSILAASNISLLAEGKIL